MSKETPEKLKLFRTEKKRDTVLVFKYFWDKTNYLLCFHPRYSNSMQNVEIQQNHISKSRNICLLYIKVSFIKTNC